MDEAVFRRFFGSATMEKRLLGKTGMAVSVLGHGGAEMGYQGVEQDIATRLLNEALDSGLNVIDTAECYGNSEELIGKAVGRRRGEFFLFTKCGHAAGLGLPEWSKELLKASIERSLRRLQTDRVDLVQLHSCSAEKLRQGEVVRVLEEAKRAGQTRFIGYSGDGEAARVALELGVFDTLQTSVNVADQECIELTLPVALAKGVGVIAKRPVANAAWRHVAMEEGYEKPYWERLKLLRYDFLHKPLGEAIATALRFTLACPGVCTAIVGTSKPGRWKENAAAIAGGGMGKEEWEGIRRRWKEVAKKDWVGQT